MGKIPTHNGSFQPVLPIRSSQVWPAAQISTRRRIATRTVRHTMGTVLHEGLALRCSRLQPRGRPRARLEAHRPGAVHPLSQLAAPAGAIVNPRLPLDPQLHALGPEAI